MFIYAAGELNTFMSRWANKSVDTRRANVHLCYMWAKHVYVQVSEKQGTPDTGELTHIQAPGELWYIQVPGELWYIQAPGELWYI